MHLSVSFPRSLSLSVPAPVSLFLPLPSLCRHTDMKGYILAGGIACLLVADVGAFSLGGGGFLAAKRKGGEGAALHTRLRSTDVCVYTLGVRGARNPSTIVGLSCKTSKDPWGGRIGSMGNLYDIYGDIYDIYGNIYDTYGDIYNIYGDIYDIYNSRGQDQHIVPSAVIYVI